MPEPADETEIESAAKVLVVDDDASVRAMLGYVLHDAGYVVQEASDGEEALRELLTGPPDCMILDLMMPNVDGFEVLRRRREADLAPSTRILVLTAKTEAADAAWCWELGADEYLTKPVEPERLAREVKLLLARTTEELRHRRDVGLADARELDRLEAAFAPVDETRRRS